MSQQYLTVPKVLPHRKARSRSRSRQRGGGETPTEVVLTPARPRPQTPPIPAAAEASVKAEVKSPASSWRMVNDVHSTFANGYSTYPKAGARPSVPAVDEQSGTSYDDLAEDVIAVEEERATTPPPPPPPPQPLRQRLIGTWKLESYIAHPTPESTIKRPTHPMTSRVTGFIMYTPDGYMSAQMLIPGQQSFKRGEGEEPQWAEAGKRFFAYSGPYYITNEGAGREEVLRHTFQICNLPGWIGDIQVRTHEFEDEGQVLVLGSEEPTEIKGDKRIPVLKWRRARDNSEGVPPPPTPQIKISGPGEP
ncbi:hypothetical protein LTR62_006634 [Meristemomyces frigidus]|uniref:Lipocalin-like domain-containing protein n=1 Tax=Meristemomyces frigidus TaxID=1508187 RepID=A0AAN7YTA1_9PEZI|nr:hypothetical protein LTR62_006634 [Meristemomyces frigidus]